MGEYGGGGPAFYAGVSFRRPLTYRRAIAGHDDTLDIDAPP
jgi:hypothetical protein